MRMLGMLGMLWRGVGRAEVRCAGREAVYDWCCVYT